MKKFIPLILVWLVTLIFTGCYTHIAVDDSYVYQEPYYPVPDPGFFPEEPYYPPTDPVEPIYKTRKKVKIVTPPPNKDRIRDDIRNSGGRNDGGRKSRR
jgi:hypothetical protein